MPVFHVPQMRCGHCKAAIERAIRATDATARIDVDLAARTVTVDSRLEAAALVAAMADGGYDATQRGSAGT